MFSVSWRDRRCKAWFQIFLLYVVIVQVTHELIN